MKTKLLFLFYFWASCNLFGQAPVPNPIPDWLLERWQIQTQDGGVWITDNGEYKGDQEPFDAYGLHWEYGLGKKHLKGRLYCIKDGKDVGTVWDFTEFWNPKDSLVCIIQLGSDGTLGQGNIWQGEGGVVIEQQTFTSPEGGSFEAGHKAWMEDGAHHTKSFNIVEDKWEKNRYYIWKPQKTEDE